LCGGLIGQASVERIALGGFSQVVTGH
jgi:hypothetical protein